MQWSTIRVQITAAEVETLNAIYERYVAESRSDLGFGWHLLQQPHDDVAAVPGGGEAAQISGPDHGEAADAEAADEDAADEDDEDDEDDDA
jgi:hypothetical protein